MRARRALFFYPILLAILSGLSLATVAADFTTVYSDALNARTAKDYPAAEKKFNQALKLSPNNATVLLQLGLVQAFQKKYAPALNSIRQGLTLEPENLDLLIASARVKAWAGMLVEARKEAALLVSQLPKNIAVQVLAGRLAYYARDLDAAEVSFLRALAVNPLSSVAQQGLDDVAKARQSQKQSLANASSKSEKLNWRLDTGYSRSSFTRVERQDWHEGYVNISVNQDKLTLSTRVERAKRFGQKDTYLRIGLDYRITDDANAYLMAGITPGANFLPERTIEAGGALRLWNPKGDIGATFVTLALKQKKYATGKVQNIDPGVQQYLFKDRLWLTARRIFSYDAASQSWHPGWLGQVDAQVAKNIRFFVGTSDAGESESGSTADTLARFAGLAVDITPRFGVNLSYTRENRKNAYIRNVFVAGVTIRF